MTAGRAGGSRVLHGPEAAFIFERPVRGWPEAQR